jgi:hypothetical protein
MAGDTREGQIEAPRKSHCFNIALFFVI